MDELTTRVGKWTFNGVVGNSPGPLKTIAETEKLLDTVTPMPVFGSSTLRKRMGNAPPTFYEDEAGIHTQNYIGLSNLGLPTYLPGIRRLSKQCQRLGKRFVVSLAAEHLEELVEMVNLLADVDVDIELNLTCPNVNPAKGFPVIWAFDQDLVWHTLRQIRPLVKGNLIVKLNYHPDWRYIEKSAQLLVESKVDAVALINTVPGTVVINQETLRPEMSGNLGQGGLSGYSILPIGLGTVSNYYRYLDGKVSIIGEGGIRNAFHILCYFAVGANFTRIGDLYARKGPAAIGDLTLEFVAEMERRGFEKLSDIPVFDHWK